MRAEKTIHSPIERLQQSGNNNLTFVSSGLCGISCCARCLLNITICFQIQVHTQKQNPANILQERKQFHSKDSRGAYFGTQLRHKTKKQLNNEWAWLNRMGDYFRQHRST